MRPTILLLLCAAAAASDYYYADTDQTWSGCPAGTFALHHDSELGAFVCRECPEGFFSDTAHASVCAPCPEGETTLGEGATACIPLAADGDGLIEAAR